MHDENNRRLKNAKDHKQLVDSWWFIWPGLAIAFGILLGTAWRLL